MYNNNKFIFHFGYISWSSIMYVSRNNLDTFHRFVLLGRDSERELHKKKNTHKPIYDTYIILL